MEVLIDEIKDGFCLGKTRNYKTVKIIIPDAKFNTKMTNNFAKVKITGADSFGLKGILS